MGEMLDVVLGGDTSSSNEFCFSFCGDAAVLTDVAARFDGCCPRIDISLVGKGLRIHANVFFAKHQSCVPDVFRTVDRNILCADDAPVGTECESLRRCEVDVRHEDFLTDAAHFYFAFFDPDDVALELCDLFFGEGDARGELQVFGSCDARIHERLDRVIVILVSIGKDTSCVLQYLIDDQPALVESVAEAFLHGIGVPLELLEHVVRGEESVLIGKGGIGLYEILCSRFRMEPKECARILERCDAVAEVQELLRGLIDGEGIKEAIHIPASREGNVIFIAKGSNAEGMRLPLFYLRGHEDGAVEFAYVSWMPKTPPFGIACSCIAECNGPWIGLGGNVLYRSGDVEMFARDDLAVVVFEVSLDGKVPAALDDARVCHADDVL